MALPIPELITLDIVKTLKGIRTAAGYSFTISDVERAKTPDNVPAAWKAIVGVGNPTEIARTYPLITMHLNYDVGIWIQVNEASGVAPDSLPWMVWSDVCRALMVDEHRGNNAHRTIPQVPRFGDSAVVIPVIVECRFRADDPTLRG